MQYLFYRLWQLMKGGPSENQAAFGSLTILSIIQVENLATFEMLLHHFFDIGLILNNRNEVMLYSLLPTLSVLIFNIFYLFRRRAKIEQKFNNESKLQIKLGNFMLFLYFVLSFALLVFFGNTYPIS